LLVWSFSDKELSSDWTSEGIIKEKGSDFGEERVSDAFSNLKSRNFSFLSINYFISGSKYE
jgi:hypothetical protein